MGKTSAKSLLLFAAIALVAALAGCGGGGDSGSSGSTASGGETTSASRSEGSSGKSESSSGKAVPSGALSKDEFVEQADAICEEGKKQSLEEMSAYVKQHGGESAQPSAELVVEAVQAVFIPAVRGQIDEIRALGAPQGDEGEVEAFLSAMEEGAKAASEASVSAGSQFGRSFEHAAELAHEYGLDSCAYG